MSMTERHLSLVPNPPDNFEERSASLVPESEKLNRKIVGTILEAELVLADVIARNLFVTDKS